MLPRAWRTSPRGSWRDVQSIYMLKQGAKALGVAGSREGYESYIVGFRTAQDARKIQYSLHPGAQLSLDTTRGTLESAKLGTVTLSFSPRARLTFPKSSSSGPVGDPMSDIGLHMDVVPAERFLAYPLTDAVGIALPLDVLDETDDSVTFSAFVLDPAFDAREARDRLAQRNRL